MSEELKFALQALGAISEKDTRMGSLKEVLRLFQKVQRIVYPIENITCNIDSRNASLSLSMYLYPNSFVPSVCNLTFFYSQCSWSTSYELKKRFFSDLNSFINNIKNYYYDKEGNDPTRAYILP